MSTASPGLRRAWCQAQGLATSSPPSSLAALLARTGWVRTLGGADGYLSLAARCPGLTVDRVGRALASGEITVVPAVRGCVYLVPRDHADLARSLAAGLSARRRARELEKVSVSADELERVCDAVQVALAAGPVSVRDLRKRIPDGVVRHLGAAGKKVGLTTSLTPALRHMELTGRLQRRLFDHRLDQERYLYELPAAGAAEGPSWSFEAAAQEVVALALRWFAPTTPARIADFTGLSKTVCTRALAALGAPTGDELREGQPTVVHPDAPGDGTPVPPSLLPGLDNLLAWQGAGAFVAAADQDREVVRWGRQKGSTWGTVKHVLSRTILVDAMVVGEWEWDAGRSEVVLGSYGTPLPPEVHAQAADRARLLTELGHGRAFSIETEAQLAARVERVRRLSPA